jgi:hypothetical protein
MTIWGKYEVPLACLVQAANGLKVQKSDLNELLLKA